MPYFERSGDDRWTPTEHVGGAWNTAEQHVAPALGLLAHLVEEDRDRRRDDVLVLSRLSYDILGTLPMEEVAVAVRVRRPGRTIELVEAELSHAARPAVLLRAWLLSEGESTTVAGTDLPRLPGPDTMAPWDPTTVWPGGFIDSVELRREQHGPGRGGYWVRTDVPLLDEPVSATARAAGLLDIANGMTVRADPREVAFPNLDLTAHLFRPPAPGWLGFDTTVSFGPAGHGLTSTVLHDESGPLGTIAQSLTVRPVRG
ncbi:thioesterase family protein [Nocardioides sp. Soil805]|uniref:thioesterase family protein n=1 Tax=Nocardioides sp. Soil805 TaxID=1736416 RepID=UPI000703332A|nr:thioesterase family protein [Nocardioides sp. Soil805]KRF34481.1 thioesterase [Nocardioides sp. Soil805]